MANATVYCPRCSAAIDLPMQGLGQDNTGRAAIVQLRTAAFVAHLRDCTGQQPDDQQQLPRASEDDAAAMIRTLAGVLPGGKRACTFCGVSNADCLQSVSDARKPCCDTCEADDTHPVPRGDLSCAEWAEQHGPQSS